MHTMSRTQYKILEAAAKHPDRQAVGTPRTLLALERKGLVGHVIKAPGVSSTARAYLTSAGIDAIESGA